MTFLDIFLTGFPVVMGMMSLIWIASVILKNAGIVDLFWGAGFVLLAFYYYWRIGGSEPRQIILLALVTLWGLRLSLYLAKRNIGKGEDFRYRQFRENYGADRYWWVSFFQVFLLQGILMWLISAPLLGVQYQTSQSGLNLLDGLGILVWLIGFIFEAGGDFQLARFKADPDNKGRVLDTGFWKYTRHPNYFGDACVWWGYGLICLAAGSYIPLYGPLLMTLLVIHVSGVSLLEKTLTQTKPQYNDYIRRTSAFFPWFKKG